MANLAPPRWKEMQTDETRQVEELLKKEGGFQQVDAYRYNSASIRVRVIDPRFKGKSFLQRVEMVESHLSALPERTQADVLNLLTFSPDEVPSPPPPRTRVFLLNEEFENPTPSE